MLRKLHGVLISLAIAGACVGAVGVLWSSHTQRGAGLEDAVEARMSERLPRRATIPTRPLEVPEAARQLARAPHPSTSLQPPAPPRPARPSALERVPLSDEVKSVGVEGFRTTQLAAPPEVHLSDDTL